MWLGDKRTTYEVAVVGVAAGLVVFLAGVCVVLAAGKVVPFELWAVGGGLGGSLIGILVPPPGTRRGASLSGAGVRAIVNEAALQRAVSTAELSGAKQRELRVVMDAVREVREKMGVARTVAEVAESYSPQGTRAAVTAECVARVHRAAANVAAAAARPPGADQLLQLRVWVLEAAAQGAEGAATDIGPEPTSGWLARFPMPEAKLAIPLAIFVVSLVCGLVLVTGIVVHPHKAYVYTAKHAGYGLLTLTSATAGAVVGLFVPAPSGGSSAA
jgi:hypothetical protein